ncbi:MAG: MSMEG_4193 family putative phosphomutase [Caldilineaceae bacterium]
MSETTTYVLLIRHGENDWVGTDRLAGRTPGVHLNEKGKQQAQELAAMLSQQPIAAVYSSPLERCMETAQPLAEALNLTVCAEEGVKEVDYGQWQGGNLKELAKLPEWRQVQHYPSLFRFPEGETLREVQSRAVATIDRLCVQHPNQVVAIFSHGDVIRTTIAHYIGTPIDLFQRVMISTASVSTLGFFGHVPAVLAVNYRPQFAKLEIKLEDKSSEDKSSNES